MRLVLLIGSGLLPAARRARWREESLALLLDVDPRRRRRYAADLLLKLPVLAWELRRGAGRPSPAAVVAGLGLLLAATGVLTAVFLGHLVGEDSAEVLFLLAPIALAPFLIREAVNTVRHRAAVAAVIVFGALGPLVAVGTLAVEDAVPGWLRPVVVTLAYAAVAGPAAWLAVASWRAIRRGEQPVVLHCLGLAAGGAFAVGVGALTAQILAGGSLAGAGLVMVLGLLAFLPTFLVWAVWAGARLTFLPPAQAVPPPA